MMKTFFCILAVALFFTGCKKFFDQRPDNTSVNPQTLQDFEEILNSDSLATTNFMLADIMSDDVFLRDAMVNLDTASFYARAYRWADHIWNPGDEDIMYSGAYRRILQMNILLGKLDEIEGDQTVKQQLRAEAYINRAWYYLQLVNIYGWDYAQATAGTDLGVPLTLVPEGVKLPFRATVKEVYDQIVQDLNFAVQNGILSAIGRTVKRPGRAAGYAMLSRTYLYIGRFEEAERAADSALSLRNILFDYNGGMVVPRRLSDLQQNPETLLARICIDYSFLSKYSYAFFGESNFISLFENNDSRQSGFFDVINQYRPSDATSLLTFNYSLGVPEVLLIKAECLARRGADAQAIELINQLRQKRLIKYEPLNPSDSVLGEVLKERRRELFYHGGLRLFDLKRFNREADLKQDIYRFKSDSTVLAKLTPQSPRYLMEFSPMVIANNPNMQQNPR